VVAVRVTCGMVLVTLLRLSSLSFDRLFSQSSSWCSAGWLAIRRELLQAFERLEDRAGPGPVGGEVQGGAAGVAGELPGDVEDPVAKPLGFT
jgi:hypothetical protein